MSKNAYGMTTADKRGVFVAIGTVVTFVLFLSTLSALSDKSWSPLILAGQIGGIVVGTVALFYVVIRGLWTAAKRLFPEDK